MKKRVITGVGPDKPGIVAGLTQVIDRYGGNIEDSSMTILGRHFAMILIVSFPDTLSEDHLHDDLKTVGTRLGLSIDSHPLEEGAAEKTSAAEGTPYMISVSGVDHAGITYQVADLLAQHRVNITDLNAQVIEGEETPVYIMMIEAEIPSLTPMAPLLNALKSLEKDLSVEIQCRQIESVAL